MKKLFPSVLMLLLLATACNDDDESRTAPVGMPNTCLSGNEIVISNITGTGNVTIDRVKVNITGEDWQIIGSVEAPYSEGKAVLSLPAMLPEEDLQKVVRDHKGDYSGHWYAETDNAHARVAGLGDIVAYCNDKPVGVLHLTDWEGEGSIVHKSWIYYHYTNQPFTLQTLTGRPGSYQYSASFQTGWNAYANTNLSEYSGAGSVLCTTNIKEEGTYEWRLVAY